MDASSSRASPLARWAFTLQRRLPGLSSCHGVDLCVLIGVGLLLLQMWWPCQRWPSSCRSSSLPRRGSWIARKAPLQRGWMDWCLLSLSLGRCRRNARPIMPRPRLSCNTSLLECSPQVPGLNDISTSTNHSRQARFTSACRRWTWRYKR
jgi:hypothetical protein